MARKKSSSTEDQSESKELVEKGKSPTYIVGLGASAGGLEALEAFFSGMPVDTGMAFVVIQHLAPDFKSLMDELLARCTTMAIHKSMNNMKIEPNSIYLIPPKKEMIIKGGSLILRDRNLSVGVLNLPIDIFFHSLAVDYQSNAIGIVLSGTGSDGSKGICTIHEQGGLVLCQNPESASFDGMPNSAIHTAVVDVVLNPNQMPEILVEFTTHRQAFEDSAQLKKIGDENDIYSPIFMKIKEVYGVDFQYYKTGTIGRRIERRMSLTRNLTVDDYIECLAQNQHEVDLLYRDLLIGVTQFFRDPEYWDYVEDEVIPRLCKDVSHGKELRLWVAACSSGEEAYTLAILVHEYLKSHNKPINVRLFATDLHKDSLSIAGRGVYSQTSVSSISPNRLKTYFMQNSEGQYEISPDIRRMVVFAQHNVFKDPPFTKIDFISCRNLLIYFTLTAQKRVISLFHFALKVNGVLFLGPSETLGDLKNEFKELHRRYKVFVKRRDIKLHGSLSQLSTSVAEKSGNLLLREPLAGSGSIGGRDLNMIRAYDTLLQKYVPPSLLVEHNGTLVYTFGDASNYLQSPKGISSLNILDVIHPDLRTAVATGLQRTATTSERVSYGGIKVGHTNAMSDIVRLSIEPLSQVKPSDYVLITFEEVQKMEDAIALSERKAVENVIDIASVPNLTNDHVIQLEKELQYTKENLQATVEELETSNEELQATNEELMASNEELQSTNEELHSVNEELYTVNREYEEKIEELTQLNDDMDNLLSATNIGTIFLDRNLKIRKFTPAAAQQFSLMTQDVGRPISHLNRNIEYDDFQDALDRVRETGVSVSHEVKNSDNQWYLMGIHPYVNDKNEINGVVITFVEISVIKEVSHEISQRNEDLQAFAYAISHDLNEPVRILTRFSELLVSDTGPHDDKDEKIQFIVKQIKESSAQLKLMLDGTLKFSRVVTQGSELVEVDLNKCLNTAKQRLEKDIAKTSATITSQGLPKIMGDEVQLTRAFVELIDNSIKFRKDNEPPAITISCQELDDEMVIKYQDNGVGVQLSQPERIFDIFFNENNGKKLLGLGLGLSITKRIIERHQGKIAYSQDPNGSQFIMTFSQEN